MHLVCSKKIVKIRNSDGFTAFQIFKKFNFFKNDYDEWFVKIDAHDEALILMSNFKKEHFTYKLKNALNLESMN